MEIRDGSSPAPNGDPGDAFVVARAVEEARLRSAPVRVLKNNPPQFDDKVHDASAEVDNLLARASLERSMGRWRPINPGLAETTRHHGDAVSSREGDAK